MVNGWYTLSPKNKLLAFLSLSILLVSCSKATQKQLSNPISNSEKLQNGDLVCRLGNGFFSDYFRKYASSEKKYSHIGILSIEKDTVYVYHAEASELTGVGYVKREPLQIFLKDIEIYDFFYLDYTLETKAKIVAIAQNYYKQKTSFDLDFDNSTDESMYCTELVAKSINQALGTLEILPTIQISNKKVYALDDIYKNQHSEPILSN